MKVFKMTNSADRLWNIKGSFGEFDAEVKSDVDAFYAENGYISVNAHFWYQNPHHYK